MTVLDLNDTPRATSLFSWLRAILHREFAPVEQTGATTRASATSISSKAPAFHGQWRVLKDL